MNISQILSNAIGIPAPVANVDARSVAKVNASMITRESGNGPKIDSQTETSKEPSEAEIQSTVAQLNQIMNANNSVGFKVDQASGRMVIQVVDRETDTVIRQIPSKEIIEISKALDGKAGLLLKDQA